MPKKTEKNLLVGLDIGTSKVVAIVGEGDTGGRPGCVWVKTRKGSVSTKGAFHKGLPVLACHRRTVPSSLAVTTSWPSWEKPMLLISPVWPLSISCF